MITNLGLERMISIDCRGFNKCIFLSQSSVRSHAVSFRRYPRDCTSLLFCCEYCARTNKSSLTTKSLSVPLCYNCYRWPCHWPTVGHCVERGSVAAWVFHAEAPVWRQSIAFKIDCSDLSGYRHLRTIAMRSLGYAFPWQGGYLITYLGRGPIWRSSLVGVVIYW